MDKLKVKQVPIELVNVLMNNHDGRKKTLMEGAQVKLQQRTKDVLDSIKKQNGMSSISNTIDLIIGALSMYQMQEIEDLKDVIIYDINQAKDVKYNGHVRAVNVNGREFYSVSRCANQYRCSRQTVLNRINDLENPKWKKWNYADEMNNLDIKYNKNRVVDKEDK
jgi:hypothetical protein